MPEGLCVCSRFFFSPLQEILCSALVLRAQLSGEESSKHNTINFFNAPCHHLATSCVSLIEYLSDYKNTRCKWPFEMHLRQIAVGTHKPLQEVV